MRALLKRWWFGVLLIGASCFLISFVVRMARTENSRASLLVRLGMTKAEVHKMLGQPKAFSSDFPSKAVDVWDDPGRYVVYSGPGDEAVVIKRGVLLPRLNRTLWQRIQDEYRYQKA